MNIAWKRPFIWLKRFPHRRGYGVHSPTAFRFITQVVLQPTPYYKYSELKQQEQALPKSERGYEPMRVKRLLFRLANECRADVIIDAGNLSFSAAYLKAARVNASYLPVRELNELFLEVDQPIHFLYLHRYRDVQFMKRVFEVCASRACPCTLFVIEGIGYSEEMASLWRQMQQDERVGVTYDLYDVGILCFDHSKNKQHYIVNF